ncbi:MAG: HslU--HslV peptidase ATPase subunit [Sulfurospirillaceae bacterium]|nr:HslU--HslV peptidase ATPase subunit [Sulfurospirillaceae bacterium]MDD2827384.1 HslU--HslV peptidase ATPase subunit [Sulfurospirillaceae bacterium]
MNLTPKEIVAYLDEYIIGQFNAKKSIAIALRNRYRRLKLTGNMAEEVMPKNILMIGSTGVGKTEIARRMAKMLGLPFVKVEASKYTEVGFVGRDVESMVRDLMMASINLVKAEHRDKNRDNIDDYVEKTIIEKLLPPLPKGASEEKKADYEKSFERMRQKFRAQEMDELKIEIELSQASSDLGDSSLPPEMVKVQESFIKILGSGQSSIKKEMKVKDAKEALKHEASEKLLDIEAVKTEAKDRCQNGGIIFIDEIDKIAVSASASHRSDPSKEGVQRDLLPIVEGSDVNTKFGTIKTDHILFISAGAFHVSKPSDLIPELQGRFPLRVELSSLTEDILYQILTQPKNSLLRQYEALLKTEGVELIFDNEAIVAIAKIAQMTNEKTEDIGARRLHTIIEKVLEDISFTADEHAGKSIHVTKDLVHDKLDAIVENEDSSRYIL